MPLSDDYGTQDDDTEFMAAATQVGAMANADFEPSPRPKKRQRRLGPRDSGRGTEDEADSQVEDSEDDVDSTASSPRLAARKTVDKTNASNAGIEPESDPEYYFPGEIGGPNDTAPKNPKHRVHVPKDGGYLEKRIFTQTQVGLDSSPSHFRGPVWKRPALPPPPPAFGVQTTQVLLPQTDDRSVGVGNRLKQSTLMAFGPPANASTRAALPVDYIQRDTELARRLQADEDAVVQRSITQRIETNALKAAPVFDPLEELADLPSDAFSSSSPEKSPTKEIITISSQPIGSLQANSGLRGPQHGLKQMTIFGQPATQGLTASQAATKRHAWPLKSRDEPPTHHKLDEMNLEKWVYPTNLGSFRDYQFNIVARSLFHNTLVALPTGLGKTFIAATVMLNYYRWTTDAQIVFMAPTKPLIAQQMEACYHIVGIPRCDTVLMTGETTPALRAEEWLEKRVFFMTPQTVINDLKTGICDPKRIVLVVVDEAHKASGGYAYTEVIAFLRRFNNSFRVNALTATPGSTVEAVQGVIDSLGIARVELRTEQSLDIRQYTHEKHTETELFDWGEEQQHIMEQISKALQPSVDKLRQQNAYWARDPMQLTAFGLTKARQKWMGSDAGRRAPMPLKGMVNNLFATLSSLAHSLGMLKFHGIGPFYSGMLSFQKDIVSGHKKGKTVTAIAQSEHFTKMMSQLRSWTNNADFIGHPKLEYLRQVVLNHFLDAGEGGSEHNARRREATRIMVFASYRESTEEICRVLKRNEPMIRPHVFVGQAASKGSEGMDQKRQNAVIQDFKSGKYNTLVATSIGEEGLDIGDVDLIICYDASSSPIRMLQRIGRTGRKRTGRVVLLLMKGKEENDYGKAQDNYAWIQKSIADPSRYTYRDDQSPRILPKDVQPQVDKCVIEIPVENSQPIDLNEKARKARGKNKNLKRPPKKFHMPDGVRTGFVKASKIDSEDEEAEAESTSKRKAPAKRKAVKTGGAQVNVTPQPDPVQLPFLDDVLLNAIQTRELERKYAHSAAEESDIFIRAPDPTRYPDSFGRLGPTKYVPHGVVSNNVSKAMESMHNFNDGEIERMNGLLDKSVLELPSYAKSTLVDATGSHGRVLDIEDDLPELPEHLPMATKRVPQKRKPTRAAQTGRGTNTQTAVCNDGPVANVLEPPVGRKKPARKRVVTYGPSALEGEESSPEPTPANMRIGTQGIDLGSHDTSGEDEEDEHDSELDDFVVRSDQPIEMASSSQRLPDDTQIPRRSKARRPLHNRSAAARQLAQARPFAIDSENEDEDDPIDALPLSGDDTQARSSDVEEVGQATKPAITRGRYKRVVASSDSDE